MNKNILAFLSKFHVDLQLNLQESHYPKLVQFIQKKIVFQNWFVIDWMILKNTIWKFQQIPKFYQSLLQN